MGSDETTDPRDAEIARLRALVEQRTAERDVWSGEACREEQAAGNGPCGACRYCYPAQLAAAQAEVERLNTQIADWNDEGWPEWNRINESRQRAIIERMEAQADNAALRGALDMAHEVVASVADSWPIAFERVTEALATPAPGAPLLDAVRGLVEAAERIPLSADCTWREQRAGHDWPAALDALAQALAAVRALLGTA